MTVAQFDRLEVLNSIANTGLIPLFHHDDPATAQKIVDACVAGGATVIEFTNRSAGAWPLFAQLLAHTRANHRRTKLGIGSIVDAPTAALFINSGADFVVGPTFSAEIAALCNRRKVAYIPGCATLSEISHAEASGVEFVKVFPGDVLGSAFVKAVHGPQPWTRMIVTGGVLATESSIREWFQAGATAVGMGSHLIRQDWLTEDKYGEITKAVARLLTWIRQARSGS